MIDIIILGTCFSTSMPVFSVITALLCFLPGGTWHFPSNLVLCCHSSSFLGLPSLVFTSQCMTCFASLPSSIHKTCPNQLRLSSSFRSAVFSVTYLFRTWLFNRWKASITDIFSERAGTGTGTGSARSKVALALPWNIFWTGLGPCTAFAHDM